MLYRRSYLESRKVLADSGEVTVDITPRDPITGLWIEIRATNGTTNNRGNLVADCISSIEVIDGSDVLYSLDGHEAAALTMLLGGQVPSWLVDEHPSNVQDMSIFIPFGRWWGDEEYSLNPRRFTNPQVRVAWNLATITAVGVTGFTSGTGRLTVVADIMEGAREPRGFLMTKQHYTSTGAASGDDYVDLPRDHPIAMLLLRAYKSATAMNTVISQVKIDIESGRHVPLDMRMTDLIRVMSMKLPLITYRHSFHAADGDTIKTIPKFGESVSLLPCDIDDTVVGYNHVGYGEGAIRLDTAGSAQSTARRLLAVVTGWWPFGVIGIPFGDLRTPATWLPGPSFSSMRAILTQGAASSTIAIALVQERLY